MSHLGWKEDFAIRREYAMETLKLTLDNVECAPYPPAGLLEKMQHMYRFDDVDEYLNVVARISFFKRGEIKREIKNSWINWITDFAKTVATLTKKNRELEVMRSNEWTPENCIILELFPKTELGRPLYNLDYHSFLSYSTIIRLLEIAGRIKVHNQYGKNVNMFYVYNKGSENAEFSTFSGPYSLCFKKFELKNSTRPLNGSLPQMNFQTS